jgi:adenosylcobyric acid synthase
MAARALMLQGTGSDVGKSILVAGLCRAYVRRGLRVLPFKPQNMSNNAAVTASGGEIGRAQWLQALAAKVPPSVDMNPVLLKPESDTGAQIILHGKPYGRAEADNYQSLKAVLLPSVLASFERLKADADLVLVEGAGSPAEVNLRENDIANMGFALPTKTPVVLVGDINRGGVIAAICGTHGLLPPAERALIKGTIINMFRGDVRLFDGGLARIEVETGWPTFGVLPFLTCVKALPAEDAVILETPGYRRGARFTVAVPLLPRIANFDDLDPLKAEPNIDVIFVPPGTPLPQHADLIIVPGSKATIADLRFLKGQGWDTDIKAHVRAGKAVLGICGGYQMLGKHVTDVCGIEGSPAEEKGIGLLDLETVFGPNKAAEVVTAQMSHLKGTVEGYEIHAGQSKLGEGLIPFMKVGKRIIGVKSAALPVYGTYLHGLFGNGEFRQKFMQEIGGNASNEAFGPKVEAALDALAGALEQHLDLDALLDAAQ